LAPGAKLLAKLHMKESIRQQLLELNWKFYREHAQSFAESRQQIQPGYWSILDGLALPVRDLLDVGCGAGTLGRTLIDSGRISSYCGVDYSEELLSIGRQTGLDRLHRRDISGAGFLEGLGYFPVIACLGTLHHMPGFKARVAILRELTKHLLPDGIVVTANWQFLSSERQRSKIVSWESIGIDADEMEPGDHLITWNRDGFGIRYVTQIDESQSQALAAAAGLRVVRTYRSDGRENNLGLYTVMAARQSPSSATSSTD